MRRKILIMLMALITLMGLMTVGNAESGDALGTWYLVSLEMGGMVMSPGDLGMEMTITVNEDGTAVISTTGEEDMAGAWQMDGQSIAIEIDGDAIAFNFVDGFMLVDDDGVVMKYSKDPNDAQSEPASPVVETAELNDFIGLWSATTIEMGGVKLPMETSGQQLEIEIKEDKALLNGGTEIEERAIEFKDGAVSLIPGEDAFGETAVLYLHEDGTVSYTETGLVIWFESIEESKMVPMVPVEGDDIDLDNGEGADADALKDAALSQPALNKAYIVTKAETIDNTSLALEVLGDYSVIFYEDGTAMMVVGGTEMAGCTWAAGEDNVTLDFYGTPFVFVENENGYVLNYYDAMLLTYEAQ